MKQDEKPQVGQQKASVGPPKGDAKKKAAIEKILQFAEKKGEPFINIVGQNEFVDKGYDVVFSNGANLRVQEKIYNNDHEYDSKDIILRYSDSAGRSYGEPMAVRSDQGIFTQ